MFTLISRLTFLYAVIIFAFSTRTDTDFCVETSRMCRNPITNEIDHIKVSSIPSSQICPSGNIFDDPRVPGAIQ